MTTLRVKTDCLSPVGQASQHPARVIDACQQRRWYHQVQGEGRDADREQAIALARLEHTTREKQTHGSSPVGQDTRPEALAEVTRSPLDPARGIVNAMLGTVLAVAALALFIVAVKWALPAVLGWLLDAPIWYR